MGWMIELVGTYGRIAVFVLILLEYACFPLPSEVVLPFSGALASQNGWSFLSVWGLSIAAGVLGAFVCYLIGWFGGRPLVEAVKRRFPKARRGLEASQSKYEAYASLSCCVGRLIPLCRTYISFFAGISRQNLLAYLGATALGAAIWNAALLGLGFVFAENWNIASKYYDQYKMIVVPILIALAGIWILRRVLRKKTSKNSG